MSVQERIYIGEAAERLDRRRATIRGWEREEVLPRRMRARRDERGWRYWTPEQIEMIRRWIVRTDMRPGKAFLHYQPTPEQVAEHIAKTRRTRGEDLPTG